MPLERAVHAPRVVRRPDERVGTTLCGRWTLTGVLGSGGMATVYKAMNAVGRVVAVKMLHPEVAEDEEAAKRFSYEARSANGVSHPGAVAVYESGVSEDGLPFLVMEYLQGRALGDRLKKGVTLPEAEAFAIAERVLDVLVAAHGQGIIHRDVKPANIFVTDDGRVKLLDFGIAKAVSIQRSLQTRSGAMLGTLGFMPPEQVAGSVDPRSDLFSVGATLFRALVGRVVHRGGDLVETLKLVASSPAPRLQSVAPHLSEAVALVVDRALEFDPANRYPDAETMQSDVQAVLRGEAPPWAATHRVDDDPTYVPSIADPRTSERSAAERLVGGTVGNGYRLERLLGRGGMGAVYRSTTKAGEPCAVKVILAHDDGEGSNAEERFRREAALAARIVHPNVVRTLGADVDTRVGHPYFVMELLDGRDLASWLREIGPLEATTAVRIFIQACHGVAAAHALAIVHRDLKPANIVLDRQGDVLVPKICDFGLAKNTLTEAGEHGHSLTKSGGALLGTPQYTAPEQAMQAKTADARADVWGLAISLYEALSGKKPWARCETLAQLLLAICTESVPRLESIAPWVDPALANVVHRGLERDREARWSSVEAFAEALRPFAGDDVGIRAEDLVRADTSRARAPSLPGTSVAAASLDAVTAVRGPTVSASRSRAPWAAVALIAAGMAVGWFTLRPRPSNEPTPAASAVLPTDAVPSARTSAASASESAAAPASGSAGAAPPVATSAMASATPSAHVAPKFPPATNPAAKKSTAPAPPASPAPRAAEGLQFKSTW